MYSALQPLSLNGAQLLQAEAKNPKSKTVYEGCHYLHAYNQMSCLGKSQSKFASAADGNAVHP